MRSKSFLTAALLLVTAIPLGGCAHAVGAKSAFPTREELDTIAKSPVDAKPARNVHAAESWTVDLNGESAAFPASVVEAKWQERAGDRATTFAPELRCVAHALAQFQAEHGADPDESLHRLMVRGCGFTSPELVASSLSIAGSAQATDAQLVDALVTPSKVPFPLLYRGSRSGVAIARSGKRAVLVLALGRAAEPATFSSPDAAGNVAVSATLSADAAGAFAYINQGHAAARACERVTPTDADATARWSCTMAEGDPSAWIEVMAVPKGLVLSRVVAQAFVRRDPKAPLEYKPTAVAARPVTEPSTFVNAVLEGVNARRAEASLPPLVLADRQTKGGNEHLAPHYFQAELVGDSVKANQVALGLLAGWDVDGTIRNGGFFGYLLSGTSDAARWVESALEMPSSRISLLDKDARKIAIGASPPKTLGGLGAVVTTYALYDNPNHAADEEALFARIAKARAAKGLPPPLRLPSTAALTRAEARIMSGDSSNKEALADVMRDESERTGKALFGSLIETTRVELAPLDPKLLAPGKLSLMVGATHHKAEGAPWGTLIFVVLGVPE